jgi:hypothetical protein
MTNDSISGFVNLMQQRWQKAEIKPEKRTRCFLCYHVVLRPISAFCCRNVVITMKLEDVDRTQSPGTVVWSPLAGQANYLACGTFGGTLGSDFLDTSSHLEIFQLGIHKSKPKEKGSSSPASVHVVGKTTAGAFVSSE